MRRRFSIASCCVIALALVGMLCAAADASVIRVKWDSPADGPGNDWDHACHTVTAATAASVAGDEIWVAGDASHPYVENITLKDGVGLYGGFAGGETTRDERQWWVNETILDGGEAGSVVTVARGVSAATVLSGFTIRNGKAASGGGIYCYGASPAILNNRITGNTATTVGAGITIASSSGVVASCLIVSNSGAQVGSGIYCTGGSPRLVNNTVVGNSSVSQGAIVLSGTSAVLANSVIAFNSSGVVKGGGTPSLKNNCVFGNTAYDYAGFVTDPTGTDGNISEDPAFADATAGDYRLAMESPCVQAGDSAQVGADWRDLGGQPRVDSWLVDMGAYELVIEHGIIRVKWDSPYDGPGNDWDHAYHTVTAAIATSVAGDEIWVAGDAEHPYVENITLKGGEGLYGGFAGGETTRDERDWTTNVTILDGGGSETVVRHAYAVTAATVLDGFTIRNGDDGIHSSSYSSTITNNTISGNEGYGIYCSLYYPSITNNTISGNGDGIYCDRFSSPSITNNTISANSRIGIICDSSSPTITNNTISGNSDNGIYCSESSSPTITNNIVAFNATGIYNSSGTPVLGGNCVFNPDGTNYSGLAAGASDITADPKLMSAAYGKLHIQPGSPCVDAGLDSVVGAGWKDMDGQARIQGPHVDIGADESDGTVWPEFVPVIVRVSPDGVDDAAHDGSSWELAKRSVQAGIDAAKAVGGDVWVAAGVYSESIRLPAYVYLYGGFAGDESSWGERDWGVHSTVLDGGEGDYVVTAAGGHRQSAIDGFTIRNGSNGIYCFLSSPSITNNTISGNGDGISLDWFSSPWIADNTISGNSDWGIDCWYSSPSITNNTISGNGKIGIYCTSYSSPSITNNTVSGNGDGISCINSSSPWITNNTISGNGDGIHCNSSSPSIANNTISGNGDGISCEGSSPTITNNIVAFNATGIYRSGGNPVLRSNCVFNPDGTNHGGLTAGTGDISEDPLLADRAAGNLRLLHGSPCIDAGDDAGVPPWLTVDKDGNPRISGSHVDMGAYEFQHLATSIPNARGGKDGAHVSLTGVIVTAAWPDVFYVEQPDRACGIRVEKAGHGLAAGQSATVEGVMGTTTDGERMITASSASGSAGQALLALGMTSRSLGGAASAGYSAATGTGQQGVTGGAGLNNIGLLVRVAGKVTFVDPGGQFFTIWDGSLVKDADGHDGVRVWAPGLTLPALDEFATVTGISSCYKAGADLFPLVRVREAGDILRFTLDRAPANTSLAPSASNSLSVGTKTVLTATYTDPDGHADIRTPTLC